MTYHDILHIIIFNGTLILKGTLISTLVLSLILFFVYPITYDAQTTILPPQQNDQFGSLGSVIAGQDFSNLITGGISTSSSQLYEEILKSRTAAVFVVNKYNLVKYFHVNNIYEAAKKLENSLTVEITKEGIIKVDAEVSTPLFPLAGIVRDSARNLSADLSNAFVEALDKINKEKLSSKAGKARQYIETQLTETKSRLDSAETSLTEFQQKHKAVSLPEQLSAAIAAASKLKSEIVKNEVELGIARTNLREDSKEVASLKENLVELKNQYGKMEAGSNDYLLSFKDLPVLSKQLTSLLREVNIQNELYLLLQQQYYKEKIQENRDLPTVQVLDKAIPPLKASSPRIIFSTFTGALFFFLLSSLVFIIDGRKNYYYNLERKDKIV
ncbi:MAG: GumC domain-containing protein [Ignavibacteriaceae bacterium]